MQPERRTRPAVVGEAASVSKETVERVSQIGPYGALRSPIRNA